MLTSSRLSRRVILHIMSRHMWGRVSLSEQCGSYAVLQLMLGQSRVAFKISRNSHYEYSLSAS